MQRGDRFNANIAAPIPLGCTNAHHIAAWIALQKPYIVYGNGAPIAMFALCALVLFVSNWGINPAITALASCVVNRGPFQTPLLPIDTFPIARLFDLPNLTQSELQRPLSLDARRLASATPRPLEEEGARGLRAKEPIGGNHAKDARRFARPYG